MQWVIVTGGGTGIGRALVHHFSKTHHVLTCGRRLSALERTRADSPNPDRVHIVQADVADPQHRSHFASMLPPSAETRLLVQNAAVGDPNRLEDVDCTHLEYTFRVNVVAPLALVQAFLPSLRAAGGRVLHIGTSVAHRAQEGTLTYGVSKMAFHRLYEQINAEGLGVVCGSLSPGMVDTPGVLDHVQKARAHSLPHVTYFEQAYENNWLTPTTGVTLITVNRYCFN